MDKRLRMEFGSAFNRKSKIQNLKWLVLGAMLFALCVSAEAQQAKKVPRIGYLSGGSPSSVSARTEVFRQGLRELGYVEGTSIIMEYRYAEGKLDRLPDLAAELVHLKVDVIVAAGGTATALPARQATRTIPIVMTNVGDPVARGLIASLAQPGGNITGLTSASPDLSGKRLELLKEAVPRLTRVAVLWEPSDQGAAANFKETEAAARALAVQLQSLEVRSLEDFESAFKEATKARSAALAVIASPVITSNQKQIAHLATKNRLPAIYPRGDYVASGGLMSYGADQFEPYRRAATYVDKILKGAKPADLPVEQPMKFELVINLKTAKQIGLTIPPNVLVRADRVIK